MEVLDYFKPFGIDLFCVGKKFLVLNLVQRNLKVKYRRSVLGVFWTLLSPLAQVCVFYFVFKIVMKVQMPHYLAYLVSGIIPWSYFAQSLSEGVEALVGNEKLISKVPVPVQVFPYAGTITNFITLLLALPILLGVSLFSGVHLGLPLLLLPFLILLLFLICYCLSLVLSVLYVYFRDLKHLISIIVQIWFYGTPVVYSVEMIPAKYHWILYANPLGGCFVGFQKVLGAGAFPPMPLLLSSTLWTLLIVGLSLLLFHSTYRDVAENL